MRLLCYKPNAKQSTITFFILGKFNGNNIIRFLIAILIAGIVDVAHFAMTIIIALIIKPKYGLQEIK